MTCLAGTVVHGDGRGRELGFPTANLAVDGEAPGDDAAGVHAARVEGVDVDDPWLAVVNIGRRPTFGGNDPVRIEVHLLGHEGDLYGRHLRLTLVHKLRDERAFDGVEALTAQIARDIEAARAACGGRT